MCWLWGHGGLVEGGLGSGRAWTRCETPPERGGAGTGRQSLVILVEPRYPGTAHCFFAQEPVEAGGDMSGTMQGHPNSWWGPPFSDPHRGAPPYAPLKPLLPWHFPLALTADSLQT